jgi:hypothetical protein
LQSRRRFRVAAGLRPSHAATRRETSPTASSRVAGKPQRNLTAVGRYLRKSRSTCADAVTTNSSTGAAVKNASRWSKQNFELMNLYLSLSSTYSTEQPQCHRARWISGAALDCRVEILRGIPSRATARPADIFKNTRFGLPRVSAYEVSLRSFDSCCNSCSRQLARGLRYRPTSES